MKLSVNKILHHWTSKKPNKKFKVWEFQASLTFNPFWFLSFTLDPEYIDIDICGLIAFNLRKDSECDHEGIYFNLKLFGLDLDLNYYDVRHWDYENDCHEDGGDPDSWSRI